MSLVMQAKPKSAMADFGFFIFHCLKEDGDVFLEKQEERNTD